MKEKITPELVAFIISVIIYCIIITSGLAWYIVEFILPINPFNAIIYFAGVGLYNGYTLWTLQSAYNDNRARAIEEKEE